MIEKEFLSHDYSTEDVYVATTYKERTIQSAYAQLDGIYARTLTYPEYDEYFTL